MILSAATAGLAQSVEQGGLIENLQVKEISVAEIDSSHVKVTVNLSLIPQKTATLKDIQLCSLHLNGLPVFAAPLSQELLLRKGVPTAFPPVYVTALFRDLNTVQPLRQMIETQSVHVQGELVAGVQLGFVEKLALHTQHPKVDVTISQDVAVVMGDSPFQRQVELGLLSVIEAGMRATDVAGKVIPGMKAAWIRDLEARTLPNLFWVESSYSLLKEKTAFPVTSDALGFRVFSGKVVTTAEELEPWKYDAEFLGAVKTGAAKLVKQNPEIQLRSLNTNDASLRLSAGDFAAETRGTAEKEQVTAVVNDHSHDQVQVLRRAAPTSLAVLTPRTPVSSTGLSEAPAEVIAQKSWEHVAVFRLKIDPATGERSVETLQLGAKREGSGIRLSQPVDVAVFGSPIMTPEGVIGLVQDEYSGAFLPQDLFETAPSAAR
jgi:hypothetical protein